MDNETKTNEEVKDGAKGKKKSTPDNVAFFGEAPFCLFNLSEKQQNHLTKGFYDGEHHTA